MAGTEFKLGLIINPRAGIGGPAGLKGSDNPDTAIIAAQRNSIPKVDERVTHALNEMARLGLSVRVVTASGSMGGDLCEQLHLFPHDLVYSSPDHTSAEDTFQAAQEIIKHHVDLLIFAGGDGTARDIYRAVGETQAVLGLPAGVKMHSGVFAVTPKAAASVVRSMVDHKLVAARLAEVRDIDEEAFAQGCVQARHYGEMLIPDDQLLVQSVKCSGVLDDELMLEELCEFMAEKMQPDVLYVLGSGGTLLRLKEVLGVVHPTLLGVDVWHNGQTIETDVHESQLYDLVQEYDSVMIVLSIIGGQGVILGRGNQQVSPRIVKKAGIENLQFIATQQKILALEGKPLRVDSGDDILDKEISGFRTIISGYDDAILYEIKYLS